MDWPGLETALCVVDAFLLAGGPEICLPPLSRNPPEGRFRSDIARQRNCQRW